MKCSLWWDSPSWWAGQCQSLCQGLWCLPAPTVMGSTKQHPRVQPGPGSQCSSLQATTGIKSQLHTSVKAKHYRLQLLSFLCRGHSSRGWHRTQASQNCRVWILADPGASSTARALTEHSSALAEFPIAPHALAHRVALGARSPSCLSTSFASHPWEFPSAAGIKCLAAARAFPFQHWHLMSVVTFSISCEMLLPVRVWLKQWQIFFCRSAVKGHDCAIPQAANLTDCNSLNPKLEREHRRITEGEGESVIYTIKLFNSH